jgi:hypothetical protein
MAWPVLAITATITSVMFSLKLCRVVPEATFLTTPWFGTVEFEMSLI